MSHQLKLGTISKKENSTKQPSITSWAAYDVVYKGGADLVNPTLTIAADFDTIQSYNYAYMEGRYYWIISKNMARAGYCELSLKCDVLATYKNEIGSASLYILRSSASYDGNILDAFYPQTVEHVVNAIPFDDYPGVGWSGGYYVVNVVGANTTATTTLYQLSPQNFSKFVGQLLGNIDTIQQGLSGDWIGLIEAVSNDIFQPMDYINSCMWFPDSFPGDDYASGADLYVGKWKSGIAHRTLTGTIKTLYHKQAALPKHPKAATKGDYLNAAPFSQYTLAFEPFGTVELDSAELSKCSFIDITVRVDALTGIGYLTCVGDNSSILASLTAQIGVPVQLTSHSVAPGTTVSALGFAGAALTGAAGMVPAAAAAASMASNGIATISGAIRGAVSTIGNTGSILAGMVPKALTATFYDIVPEDNARNGRPLCQVTTPAALGGFMIAQKGEVEIPGTLPEEQEIKAFLENGFYYE